MKTAEEFLTEHALQLMANFPNENYHEIEIIKQTAEWAMCIRVMEDYAQEAVADYKEQKRETWKGEERLKPNQDVYNHNADMRRERDERLSK